MTEQLANMMDSIRIEHLSGQIQAATRGVSVSCFSAAFGRTLSA